MEEEIWKPIEGFENYYEASSRGRIRSISRILEGTGIGFPRMKKGKVLSGSRVGSGYLCVFLAANGKKSKMYIHHIIARTFLAPCEGKLQVNHKDGNKTNNAYTNLEWCTPKENVRHAFMTGLSSPHHNQKNKKKVEVVDKYGHKMIFDSVADAARFIGVAQSGVSRTCSGRCKHAAGFECKFV